MSSAKGTKTRIPSTSKKDTITLAIDEAVLDIIKKDADDYGLSINSKINNILRKYAYFGESIELQYPITITSRNLQFILDNVDENTLSKAIQTIIIHILPSDFINKKNSLTLDDWMIHVCERILLFSGIIQKYSYHKDKDDHLNMVMTHNHGIKWSSVISTVLTQLLIDLLGYHAIPTTLPNSVTLKIIEMASST